MEEERGGKVSGLTEESLLIGHFGRSQVLIALGRHHCRCLRLWFSMSLQLFPLKHRVALVTFCRHLVIAFIAEAVFLFLDVLLRLIAINVSCTWLWLLRALCHGCGAQDTIALDIKLRNTGFEIEHLQGLLKIVDLFSLLS